MADFGFLIRMSVKIYKTTVKYLSSSEIPAIKKGRALLPICSKPIFMFSPPVYPVELLPPLPIAPVGRESRVGQGTTAVAPYLPPGWLVYLRFCRAGSP